jgi:aspartate racemase
MKTVGIIGGIAPESTVVYYKEIIREYQKKQKDGSYPKIIINSINMTEMLDFIKNNNLDGLVNYLLAEIYKLSNADADFGLLASNTPHLVFDDLRKKSPLPLLSIVELTRDKVKKYGFKKVTLFGTKSTMQNDFYQTAFAKEDIIVVVPDEKNQKYINEIYFGELVKGIYNVETKDRLLDIVEEIKLKEGIEGLILGGTELPLILTEERFGDVRFFDTAKIHIEGIVERLLCT